MNYRLWLFGPLFWMGAFGQTQIDLGRQVRNTLPYSSGGTSASSQIAARQTVGGPELVATDFPGADVGQQINNAFASFPAVKCGTVIVPPGDYTYSTQVFVPSGCTLAGAGRGATDTTSATVLKYNGPPATSAVVLMKQLTGVQPADRSDYVTLRDLTIKSLAGNCPNDGMLAWNPAATGPNKWECYDGTIFTVAIPHLAGMQHGQTDPALLGDGTHIRILNLAVEGWAGYPNQGAFHFGVYLNGCEECYVESVYASGSDDGFHIGTGSNGVLFNQITARLNRRAGFLYQGTNSFACVHCLFESNYWTAQGFSVDTSKYGAGIRAGDSSTSGYAVGRGGLFIGTYFENNDISLYSPGVSEIVVDNFGDSDRAGARGGWGNSKWTNCAISDASLVTIQGADNFQNGCRTTGSFNTSGTHRMIVTDPRGTWVQKIIRHDEVGGLQSVWEQDFDISGNPAYSYFRGTEFRLDTHKSATESENRASPALSFKGAKWTGSSTEFRWSMGARFSGSTTGLVTLDPAGTSVFSIREDGAVRVTPNAVAPTVQVGGTEGFVAPDQQTPTLAFQYRSDGDTSGAHIGVTRTGEAINNGSLFVDAERTQFQANGADTQVVVKGSSGTASQTSDLQQWQNGTGVVHAKVRGDGGFQLLTGAVGQPVCNASARFTMWSTPGAAGVKDKLEVCAKDAADVYAWRTLY